MYQAGMKLTILLVVLYKCTLHVSTLFVDQVGRFEWKQKNVFEAPHMGYLYWLDILHIDYIQQAQNSG